MIEATGPRKMECAREGCGRMDTERIYGEGFPGWNIIPWLMKNGKPVFICPDCTKRISDWLKGKSKDVKE